MMRRLQWLIPLVRAHEDLYRAHEDWRHTQARDDRQRQLTKAEEQRRRRAERDLKIAKSRLP